MAGTRKYGERSKFFEMTNVHNNEVYLIEVDVSLTVYNTVRIWVNGIKDAEFARLNNVFRTLCLWGGHDHRGLADGDGCFEVSWEFPRQLQDFLADPSCVSNFFAAANRSAQP